MKLNNILNIIFPPRCARCDGLTEGDFPVCKDCLPHIIRPAPSNTGCEICFMPRNSCVCSDRCYYDRFCSPLFYSGIAKRTIHRYKFRSRPDLAESYARLLLFSLEERKMLEETDIISYIPMSRRSLFRRGYNQSRLIAEKIAKASGKPCIGLLVKYRKTKNQHSLKSINRSGNLLGAYEPDKRYLEEIKGKNILLIDDVSTTGNTFNEAGKTLLIFGAESIFAASCTVKEKSKKNIEYKKIM